MTRVKYQIYAFSSEEIQANEQFLIDTINKGYNVPRFQYNVITTPRIKHSLIQDLCVTPSDKCYDIFCFADSDSNDLDTSDILVDQTEDASITRDKLKSLYPHLQIEENPIIEYDSSTKLSNSKILKFPNLPANKLLAMGCIKPHKSLDSYELTGFVSFYKKMGTYTLLQCEEFAKKLLKVNELWIYAITEHKLTDMYGNWGYLKVGKVLVPLSAEGEILDDHLENDIGASCDFHLDIMVKKL